MPIDVLCPGCGKTLRLADEHAGKTGRCPGCQTHFEIPASAAPAGFDQLVSQLQPRANAPTAQPPEKKPLFDEHHSAPSPFADSTPAKTDYNNPYSAPYAPTPFTPTNSGDPNGYATASTMLGIAAIAVSLLLFCCCFASFLSYPLSIIGLILAMQLPPDKRSTPLLLNIIALALPFLSVFTMFALGLVKNGG